LFHRSNPKGLEQRNTWNHSGTGVWNMTTANRSLKALAAQVLTQELEAEQRSGTPRNTPRGGWNMGTPARSTGPECSTFQRPGGGTVEQEENDGALLVYFRRIDMAQSWDDLYALLIDADVDCVDGILTLGDIDTLCGLCRNVSDRLPKHAPETAT
jgi:hypothetical protein